MMMIMMIAYSPYQAALPECYPTPITCSWGGGIFRQSDIGNVISLTNFPAVLKISFEL